MKRGLAVLLSIGTLVPLAAPVQAGPPRHAPPPPPPRSRTYGPQQVHHHGHSDNGWLAFGLGALFGAALEALTEPPPPPVMVVVPQAPVVYGPPPPQAYVAQPMSQPGPGPAAPYGGPPPAPWPSALAPNGAGGPGDRAPQDGAAGPEVGPEAGPGDPCCPGAGAQRVYVPPQTVWREQRVVEPAQVAVRLVPVYADVSVPVFLDVIENGVVKTVLVGSRLERRQVGTQEERVIVRPETIRVEHVAETIPGRWAYVPADAISDLPPR